MPCISPIQAFYNEASNRFVFRNHLADDVGSEILTLNDNSIIRVSDYSDTLDNFVLINKLRRDFTKYSHYDNTVFLPCNNCISCRIRRSRDTAIRCVHEAESFKNNVFISLTYSQENLPSNYSLNRLDMRKFMKDLRRFFEYHYGHVGIRAFYCGEYGELTGRPHYHALLFNCDFHDKRFFKMSGNFKLYKSDILAKIWKKGHVSLGSVNFTTASYCARYMLKKVVGPDADTYYKGRYPEFSQGPRDGLGIDYFNKYYSDIFPSDEVVILGSSKQKPKKYPVPKFYLRKLKLKDPDLHALVLLNRSKKFENFEFSFKKLEDYKVNLISRLSKLSRALDVNY